MSGKEPPLALVFLRDAKLDFLHASHYINKQIPCEEGFFFPPSQTDNALSEPLLEYKEMFYFLAITETQSTG